MLTDRTIGAFRVAGTLRESGRPRDMTGMLYWEAVPSDDGECVIAVNMTEIDMEAVRAGKDVSLAQKCIPGLPFYDKNEFKVAAGRDLLRGIGADNVDAMDELIGLVDATDRGVDVHAYVGGYFRNTVGKFPFAGWISKGDFRSRIIGKLDWSAMTRDDGDPDIRTVWAGARGRFKGRLKNKESMSIGMKDERHRDFAGLLASGDFHAQRGVLKKLEAHVRDAWTGSGTDLRLHALHAWNRGAQWGKYQWGNWNGL